MYICRDILKNVNSSAFKLEGVICSVCKVKPVTYGIPNKDKYTCLDCEKAIKWAQDRLKIHYGKTFFKFRKNNHISKFYLL